MVSRIQYYNSDDSVIRSVFPNYSSFFIGCCLVGLGGMLVAYVVITPSKQKFFQKQSVMDGRNPIYEKLLDIEKQIEELKKNN